MHYLFTIMRYLFTMVYSNPSELLARSVTDPRLWRQVWRSTLTPSLLVLAALAVAAVLSADPIRLLAYALVPTAMLIFCVGMVVPVTQHITLWLLYLFAPPALFAAFLAGVGLIWPPGLILSGVLVAPALVGILLSCACAVDVFNQSQRLLRDQSRERGNRHAGALATPIYQNRARVIRLLGTGGASLLAGLVLLLYAQVDLRLGLLASLALLVAAGGCLRIEATLRTLFPGELVRPDGEGGWSATYTGRWALLVPRRRLDKTLRQGASPAECGAALITLLRAGCIAPSLRRATAQLSNSEATRVAVSLSLQPDGASVLRYLAPALPHPVGGIALFFADLATEAVRPTDLQRWLLVLNNSQSADLEAVSEQLPMLAHALKSTHLALQCHSYDPVVEEAVLSLQQALPMLYAGDAPASPGSPAGVVWPVALLDRLLAQGRLLRRLRPESETC